jgi:hypothetical protein
MKRLVLLVLCLSACTGLPATAPPDPTLNLHAYDVPEAHAKQLASTLNTMLRGSGDAPVGSARLGPGGTLLVAGPPSVIQGVSRVVSRVQSAPSSPPPTNLAIHYWLVESTAGDYGFDPELAAIDSTLKAIAETDGPRYFQVLATQRIASLEGESATAQTSYDRGQTQFTQRILRDPHSGAYIGELELKDAKRFGQLSTRIALDPEKTAVLGTTTTADDSSLYIIVRPGVL